MPSLSAIALNCGATRRIRPAGESPRTYSEFPRCARSTLRASRTKFRGIRRCLSEGPSEALQMTPACSSMSDTFSSRVPRYACRCRQVPPIRSLGGYEWRAGLGGGLRLIRSDHLAKWKQSLMNNESPSFKRIGAAKHPAIILADSFPPVIVSSCGLGLGSKTLLTACTSAQYGGLFVRFTRLLRRTALRGSRLRVDES